MYENVEVEINGKYIPGELIGLTTSYNEVAMATVRLSPYEEIVVPYQELKLIKKRRKHESIL